MASNKRKYLPNEVRIAPDGTEADTGEEGLPAWFMSTPFAFCLRCRVSYEQVRGSDFSKLATLDQEGRSSAVTILSATVVRALRGMSEQELEARARKLLTFVDNRQDASLQAGHFNDFVQVAQLRGALQPRPFAAPRGSHPPRSSLRRSPPRSTSFADFAQNPGGRSSPAPEAPSRPCARSSTTGSIPT